MSQLVSGVKHIHHSDVVHRDLKLGNMLLNNDMQLKIADFGLATRVDYEGEKKMWVQLCHMILYHRFKDLFPNICMKNSR